MKPLVLLIILFLAGCLEKESPSLETTEEVKVRYINDNELSKMLNEHPDKILLVNVWATWCIPCIEEFPDLVRLYNNYKDKDLEFLSLSVDFGEKADSLVRSFMTSQQADFPVYIVSEKSSDEVINLLNPEWNGAIPATFIYDKSGKQRTFLLGAQPYAVFKQSIDSLMIL